MSKRTGDKPIDSETTARGNLNRRRFFMLGGSVVSVAAATPLIEAQARESNADQKKARYQETEHVKTFYRVNRY